MEPRTRLFVTVGLLGVGLVLGAKYVLPMVAPFLLGFILSCLIEPLVRWCERECGLPRWLAAGGVLTVAFLVAGLIIVALGVNLWLGIRSLVSSASYRAWFTDLLDGLGRSGAGVLARIPEPVHGAVLAVVRDLPDRLGQVLERSLRHLGHLPEWLVFLSLGILAAYFFSRDREMLTRYLLGLVPREWRPRAIEMKDDLLRALGGFVRAQLLLMSLTMILGIIGLLLLDVGQAILLGAILGFLDFLPMMGPGAVLLPWAGVCLAGGCWVRGLGLIVLFLALAAVRWIAEARLVGRNLGLHPLEALAAMYLGLRLMGFGGVLLGPVLLVILRALYEALALPGGIRANEVFHEKSRDPRFHRFHWMSGA